jgi:hypothetical protein
LKSEHAASRGSLLPFPLSPHSPQRWLVCVQHETTWTIQRTATTDLAASRITPLKFYWRCAFSVLTLCCCKPGGVWRARPACCRCLLDAFSGAGCCEGRCRRDGLVSLAWTVGRLAACPSAFAAAGGAGLGAYYSSHAVAVAACCTQAVACAHSPALDGSHRRTGTPSSLRFFLRGAGTWVLFLPAGQAKRFRALR